MTDPRYAKLSDLLVKYSTGLKKNERILLDMIDVPDEFTIELMRAVRRAGALPLVETRHTRVTREIIRGVNDAHADLVREVELFRMKRVQAYIAVRGAANASESADVPSGLMALYSKAIRPVLDQRVNKTRWCVLRWPTPSMAQAAGMSTEAFEDFYFDVCTMNYPRMARAMVPLQKRMNRADRVHLKAPGTDLRFSIKGIGALLAEGKRNIPDGEVFSCPVKNSVEGSFNTTRPPSTPGRNLKMSAWNSRPAKSFRPRPTIITSASMKSWIRMREPATSGNFLSASTRISSTPCAIFSLTKKSPARSTLPLARPTNRRTTATARPCIGTWSSSNAPNGAAARSGSMMNSSARTAFLSLKIYSRSIQKT